MRERRARTRIERIVIAGGGTGGHLYPGIAVLEELRRRQPHVEALFVGTARGIEARVIPAAGERLECIDVAPLKGQRAASLLRSAVGLPRAGAQALSLLRNFAPDVALGVGGYAAGPMVAAAAALGIPTALLEQNAHLGLTNRLLARLVGRAYLTYPQTLEYFPAGVPRLSGNPVRRELVQMGRMAQMEPDAFEMRARQILVIGGSQGARALNETVPAALARLGLRERGIRVLHQAGRAMCDTVRVEYERLGVPAEVVPFIDDMASAYRSAALVISRAGATTLAEVCAIGRPSVLVPYPFAADDHQWHNAVALQDAGAAIAIRQERLDAHKLGEAVQSVLSDPRRRARMGDAARAQGRPDAAASIVDDLCEWLGCDAEPEGLGVREEGVEALDGTGTPSSSRMALRAGSGRRRRPPVRRSFAWDHGDRYFGYGSVALAES